MTEKEPQQTETKTSQILESLVGELETTEAVDYPDYSCYADDDSDD